MIARYLLAFVGRFFSSNVLCIRRHPHGTPNGFRLELGVAFAFNQLAAPGCGQDHAVLGDNFSPADSEDGPTVKFFAFVNLEVLLFRPVEPKSEGKLFVGGNGWSGRSDRLIRRTPGFRLFQDRSTLTGTARDNG